MIIDFGNGITADSEGATAGIGGIGAASTGLDGFAAEVPVLENAVADGGLVGEPRLPARPMTVQVIHDELWTRREVLKAFTPGVERIISSDLGSMPYYVRMVSFPASHVQARREFTVVLVSPLACPEGDLTSAEIEAAGWAAEAISDQQTAYTGSSNEGMPWQTVTLAAGERFVGYAGLVGTGPMNAYGSQLAIFATTDGAPSGSALALSNVNESTATGWVRFDFDFVVPASGVYAIKEVAGMSNSAPWAYNTAGGYAGGRNSLNASYDNAFKVYTQQVDAGTGTATFDADTDMPVAPVVTCTMVTPSDDLVLEGEDWTTTITDTLSAGDVVEVDAAAFTVKVNGASALATFDRTGDWPRVSPGENTITVTPAAATSIAFRPRRLGLI